MLVLGGTGAVGRHVATLLAERDHHVLVGSRHLDQAEAVAAGIDGAEARHVDIGHPESVSETPGVAVNCTGIEDAVSVQRWRDAGWGVIDITASSPYASELAQAPTAGPPLLVGVGLIPGLTSVLARDLVARNPSTTSVTISCLVGLGEDYGNASRDWTYAQLGRPIDDRSDTFRNFSEPDTIEFPAGFGRRPAWRFDFADRALLPEHLGVPVTTRYCFDSRVAGRALAVASAVPVAAAALRRLNRLSRSTVGGTAWWAGVIETDTGARSTAIGNGQSHGTAAVTSIAAERIALDRASSARHFWDLVDAPTLIAEVSDLGILISD